MDTMQTDAEQILATLEDVAGYDFANTGLQNIAVGAAATVNRIGASVLSIPLTVTYYGTY
jgi:hypothetical protein